jgi:uncharacterized OsmC-like protein
MNAEQLRSLQAPLKSHYQEDPAAGQLILRAVGVLDATDITCSVETGKGLVSAGLHPAAGGDGVQACSGDMLLQALVACAGVTLRAVAIALGISIRGGDVTAEGTLDIRAALGVTRDVPVGFTEIRLRLNLQTDATPEQLSTLLRLTERYCVVYQTLKHPTAVSALIEVAAAGSDGAGPRLA